MLYYSISPYVDSVSVRVAIARVARRSFHGTIRATHHNVIHDMFERLSIWGGCDKEYDVHVVHTDGSISKHKMNSYEISKELWTPLHKQLVRGLNRGKTAMLLGVKQIEYSVPISAWVESDV